MVSIGLDVQLSALGSALQTRIAGYEVELRTPRPPLAEDGIGLLGGELTAPPFERFQNGERLREWIHDTPAAPWGKCYMREPSGGGAAWVRRCALVVPLAADFPTDRRQDVADAIFREAGPWRSCVLDWLETAFCQTLGVAGPPRIGTAIDPWLWSHDGQGWVEHYNNQPLTATGSSGETAVDASSLQQVLHLAGGLVRPPLAWRLTRDAQLQHAVGDHRRAVLDAGTAAELALHQLLKHHGRSPASDLPLGQLVGEANRVPVLEIHDAQTGLVNVRNDVIHRAATPDRSEAERVLQISRQYVALTWPRASLMFEASSPGAGQQT